MATKRICTIVGCGKPYVANGFCRKHYARVYNTGSAEIREFKSTKVLRFIREVALRSDSYECLPIPFKPARGGYVMFSFENDTVPVHRRICEQAHGPAPTAKHHAAHNCGNRLCGNYRHLEWKTAKENHADKRRHGTHLEGETVYRAQVTEAQVREMRALLGKITQREIARRYGISYKSVWNIVRRKTWKHVI